MSRPNPHGPHTVRLRRRLPAARLLGVCLALAASVTAQRISPPGPRAGPAVAGPELGGVDLAALRLAEGRRIALDLPDRLIAPLAVPIVLDGAPQVLLLEPHTLRAPGFRVLVAGADGTLVAADAPAPCTLRGAVLGLPGSEAAGSLVDGRLELLLRLGPQAPLVAIQPLPSGGHALYAEEAAVDTGGVCGTFAPGGAHAPGLAEGVEPGDLLTEVEIGLDADFEYYQLLGSDVDAVVTDLENIVGMVRLIYEVDTASTYTITTVTVRTSAADPYTTSDPSDLLDEFLNTWNQTMVGVPRDVAHLFTGREIDGAVIGIAYLGVLCQIDSAYGLSQSRFSPNLVRRVAVTAHELGHNWNALHCDATPDCAIMCAVINGCTGELQAFGSSSVASILSTKGSVGCLAIVVAPGLPTLDTVFPAFGRAGGGGVLELHGVDFPVDITPNVTLDGVEATVLTHDATLVTVTVPPGPPGTTVDVALDDGTTLTVLPDAYRYELDMELGDRVTSELAVLEVERHYFTGLAGSRVTLKLDPRDPEERLIAGVRLIGPREETLATIGGTIATQGASITLKKFVLPETGEHRLEVFAVGTTSGGYVLKTKVKAPKSVKADVTVSGGSPTPTVAFGATAGTLLKLAQFKRRAAKGDFALVDGKPSALVPTLLGLDGPDGPVGLGDGVAHSPKGAWARLKKLTLPATGDYQLRLGGLDGSIGHGKLRVKLKSPKGTSTHHVLEP